MNLSIIIPTHNRREILHEGLTSLYEAINSCNKLISASKISIIVIDDGSIDGTGLMVKKFFNEVIVLEGDGNYWWTKSINKGADFAVNIIKSEFVLLWNDDILIDVNYFINLNKILNKIDTNSTLLGSTVFDNNTKEIWSSTMTFNKYTGNTSFLKSNFNQKRHYKWLPGMGLVVSSEIIKELGYWNDVDFPQYFGDLDFTVRASKFGFNIETYKELIIYNRTEYSSFIGVDILTFMKSLKSENIGSRYNMLIRYKILSMHTNSKLWVLTYLGFYLKYFIKTFILKKN